MNLATNCYDNSLNISSYQFSNQIHLRPVYTITYSSTTANSGDERFHLCGFSGGYTHARFCDLYKRLSSDRCGCPHLTHAYIFTATN